MSCGERALRFAECLAQSLRDLDVRVWQRVVDRAQDTIDLAGFGGTLSLQGRNLVMSLPERSRSFALG